MKRLLFLLPLVLLGCNKPTQTATGIAVIPVAAPPTVENTMSDAVATGTKIDEKDINPNNVGCTVDLDGDGVVDFVIMRNNTIYFKKSQADPEVVLTTFKGDVRAYSFALIQGSRLPAFLFWDSKLNGYYMPNLGAVDGLPRFGAVESQ